MNYEFNISNHPVYGWKRKLIYVGNNIGENNLQVSFLLYLLDKDGVVIQDKNILQGSSILFYTSNDILVDKNGNQLKDKENFYMGEKDYLMEKGKIVSLYSLLEYYIGINDSNGYFN